MAKSRHRSTTLEGRGTGSTSQAFRETVSKAVLEAWNRGETESRLLFEHFEQLAEDTRAEDGVDAGTATSDSEHVRERLAHGLERVNALEPVPRRGRKRKTPPQGLAAVLTQRVLEDAKPKAALAGEERPTPDELAEAHERARLRREDPDALSAAMRQDAVDLGIAKSARDAAEVGRLERRIARLAKAAGLVQRKSAGKINGQRSAERAAPLAAQRAARVAELQAQGESLYQAAVAVALDEEALTGGCPDESTIRKSVQKVRPAKERTRKRIRA